MKSSKMFPQYLLKACNLFFASTVPFSHIGGYIFGALGFLAAFKYRNDLWKNKVFFLMSALICYGIAINLFSSEPNIGYGAMFGFFGHWLCPFTLGFILADVKIKKISFWIFYGALSVIIFFGILAYFGLFFSSIAGSYLVQDGLLKGLRSHISLAALCILLIFISIVRLIDSKDTKTKVFYSFASVFFLAAIILTGSRGYFIALAVSGIAFVTCLASRSIISLKTVLLAVIACALLSAGILAASPSLRERMAHTGKSDNNVIERLSLYKVAFWEFKDRPIFGFGPGQAIEQKKYFEKLPLEQQNVQRHPHLHSFYLNFLADFGLAGIVILLPLFGIMLIELWAIASKKREADPFIKTLSFGLFWGFIGILIGDFFDTLLLGPGTAMELFWLCGIVMGTVKK
jgi:O-antigen ligase